MRTSRGLGDNELFEESSVKDILLSLVVFYFSEGRIQPESQRKLCRYWRKSASLLKEIR